MSRPLTNRSNYWADDSLNVLEAAATITLRNCRFKIPVKRAYIELGDLISHGWYYVIRYGPKSLDKGFTDCKREMAKYVVWVEEHCLST